MAGRGVKDFLGKPAPSGYVAGLGRGATGFVTRPDLGPGSSLAIGQPLAPAPKAAVSGAGGEEEDEDRFADAENEEGLLAARGPLGADDEEADVLFSMIDQKMSTRRRIQKGSDSNAQKLSNEQDPSTIFAAEKLKLRQVTDAEWAQLPESGDFIAKRVKRTNERERYTPVPDSVLLGSSLSSSLFGGRVQDGKQPGKTAGAATAILQGMDTDFRSVGETRERVLGARLDMAGAATSNAGMQTSVDPVGYLTSMNSQATPSDTQISDLRRARLLLRNAVNSNPSNPAAWISAAKIEEVSRNMKQARATITEALEACPDSEDVWMEAVRLSAPGDGPSILAKALQRLPRSPKLWLHAADLERDPSNAKKVLRRALEENPESATLWKALIEREEDAEDARVLLAKAVECCPTHVELWIGLARLEEHENARKVLNRARQHNPMSLSIWLAAARLEEAHASPPTLVEKIIQRAVLELSQRGVVLDREAWLKEAMSCERSGDLVCAGAIVRATAMLGLELDEDGGGRDDAKREECKITWLEDVEVSMGSGAFAVADAILVFALDRFPEDEELWRRAIASKQRQSNVDVGQMRQLFERALNACPSSQHLWLEFAQFESVNSDVPTARNILSKAFSTNPTAQSVWRAAVDLELGAGEFERARVILSRAREQLNAEGFWHKSIELERRLGNRELAISLAEEGVKQHPRSETLWHALGQLDPTRWDAALSACPASVEIRIEAALSAASHHPIRGRAILELGRNMLPEEARLWIASVHLEMKLASEMQARSLLSRALQKCPTSSMLWYDAIFMEARPLRKAKAMEALRHCGHDGLLYVAVGRILEEERNLGSAKEYYDRAISSDPGNADVWAHYIIFLRKHSESATRAEADAMLQKVIDARPLGGAKWQAFQREDRWWRTGHAEVFRAFVDSLEQAQ